MTSANASIAVRSGRLKEQVLIFAIFE